MDDNISARGIVCEYGSATAKHVKVLSKTRISSALKGLVMIKKNAKTLLGFPELFAVGIRRIGPGTFHKPMRKPCQNSLEKWHFKMALGPQFQTKKHESTIRLGLRGIQIWPRPNWIQRPAGNHLLVSGWIYGLKHQVHSSTFETQTGPAHIAWGNPTYPHTWVEVNHGVPMVQGIIVRVQSIILWSNYMKSN